jgi:hypothetical protein
VIRVTEDTGWFQAPRNVAFMIIGWLYGDGDFGKSISTSVNCGDDTDCTSATLGSILGIIGGTKAIPARWREPIGEKIKTVAVAGFPIPEDINALTDHTLAMTKKVLALHNVPVEVTTATSDSSGAGSLLVSGPKEARSLWSLSPYRIVWKETDLVVTLDYVSDPVIRPGLQRSIQVTLVNQSGSEKLIRLELQGLPKGWKIQGLPSGTIKLGKDAAQSFPLTIAAPELTPGTYSMKLSVTGAQKPFVIPLTLISPKP